MTSTSNGGHGDQATTFEYNEVITRRASWQINQRGAN
jgi:hypothetical protein